MNINKNRSKAIQTNEDNPLDSTPTITLIKSRNLRILATLKTLKTLNILMFLNAKNAFYPPPDVIIISISEIITRVPSKTFIKSYKYPFTPYTINFTNISIVKIIVRKKFIYRKIGSAFSFDSDSARANVFIITHKMIKFSNIELSMAVFKILEIIIIFPLL